VHFMNNFCVSYCIRSVPVILSTHISVRKNQAKIALGPHSRPFMSLHRLGRSQFVKNKTKLFFGHQIGANTRVARFFFACDTKN
jgi:hypothetical protein